MSEGIHIPYSMRILTASTDATPRDIRAALARIGVEADDKIAEQIRFIQALQSLLDAKEAEIARLKECSRCLFVSAGGDRCTYQQRHGGNHSMYEIDAAIDAQLGEPKP